MAFQSEPFKALEAVALEGKTITDADIRKAFGFPAFEAPTQPSGGDSSYSNFKTVFPGKFSKRKKRDYLIINDYFEDILYNKDYINNKK
jgi:hypothetical protein